MRRPTGWHLALLLSAVACTSAAPRDTAAQPREDRRTIVHDGARRGYVVRRPPRSATDTARLPLVLVLHGGGGNAANAEEMTGFTRKGREAGFIVVYPEGSGRFRRGLFTWNAVHCCGYAMERRVDDIGFIDALLDTLVATERVDPARIYVTGMSNGAMMTHRLGIALGHRIAAIAPVVGTVFGDEPRARAPLSALIINGALDRAVPAKGGAPGGRSSESWDGTATQPTLAQAAYWASAGGCEGEPEVLERGAVVLRRYRCADGLAVEHHLVRDNGHAWPGGRAGARRGDTPSTAIRATDVIWAFFSGRSKPSSGR